MSVELEDPFRSLVVAYSLYELPVVQSFGVVLGMKIRRKLEGSKHFPPFV